ncbi:tetratricopeptide repeat protein [uncultured Sphingomonas sp.]|uniref:tetratricopeptide repeat protein n=1 Tax=uncultured Sphingomonas sp. TaxID=158754 RepID=UPI0035CC59E0
MGWVCLAVIGAGTLGAMLLLRVPRLLWTMVGAALMLGAAGYALQGRPTMAARGATPNAIAIPDDPMIADLRDRLFGRFTGDGAYMIAADAMERVGERRAAVQAVLGGIRHYPQSAALWTQLGTTYAMHDGGRVSPPALFAFRQAMRLAPLHPGPPFFAGLAYIRTGDFAEADIYWLRALRLSPAGTSYRRDIAVRLMLLDRFLSFQRRGGR